MKNTILKGLACLNGGVFLYAACCLDVPSRGPLLTCIVTGVYLALFARSNNWFECNLEDDEWK